MPFKHFRYDGSSITCRCTYVKNNHTSTGMFFLFEHLTPLIFHVHPAFIRAPQTPMVCQISITAEINSTTLTSFWKTDVFKCLAILALTLNATATAKNPMMI